MPVLYDRHDVEAREELDEQRVVQLRRLVEVAQQPVREAVGAVRVLQVRRPLRDVHVLATHRYTHREEQGQDRQALIPLTAAVL